MLHLTALTGLTNLTISGAKGLDDAAAAAIACHIQQLRHLELRYCELTTGACLPVIGILQHLTHLNLNGHSDMEDSAIKLLVPARALKEFECDETFSDEAYDRYCSEVLQRALL